jgi:hypothetical protein
MTIGTMTDQSFPYMTSWARISFFTTLKTDDINNCLNNAKSSQSARLHWILTQMHPAGLLVKNLMFWDAHVKLRPNIKHSLGLILCHHWQEFLSFSLTFKTDGNVTTI